jgi:hypothetical protein
MKNTLKAIYEKLQRPIEGIQKDLLLDFFSIPIETNEDKREKQSPKRKPGNVEPDEPDIPTVTGKKRAILIDKVNSGIRIFKNPYADEVPETMHLKLGYDVPRGNPIKNYQELDFDIAKAPIKIKERGVNLIKHEKNELEFEIRDEHDFEIILTGFDVKRDLFVKTM